jgi:hypothetical protein
VQANRVVCYSIANRRMETLAEIGDNPLVTFDRSTRDFYALDAEAP